jgi:hypothetical protein
MATHPADHIDHWEKAQAAYHQAVYQLYETERAYIEARQAADEAAEQDLRLFGRTPEEYDQHLARLIELRKAQRAAEIEHVNARATHCLTRSELERHERLMTWMSLANGHEIVLKHTEALTKLAEAVRTEAA